MIDTPAYHRLWDEHAELYVLLEEKKEQIAAIKREVKQYDKAIAALQKD